MHRELREVGEPVDHLDVREAHRLPHRADDEQEARAVVPVAAARGRDSSGSPVRSPKASSNMRSAGVLDRREVLEVGGAGLPDPMSLAVARES